MSPLSFVPEKLIFSPEELTIYNPPSPLEAFVKTLLPFQSIAAEVRAGKPSPILAVILAELSNKIKILAGTSPAPEPGGNGFAFVN